MSFIAKILDNLPAVLKSCCADSVQLHRRWHNNNLKGTALQTELTLHKRRWLWPLLPLIALGLWLMWANSLGDLSELLASHGRFILLGISGAIFANSTGAGGGVIFIPVFDALQFTPVQAVATSFAIQCFGMTAGALSWSYHFKKRHANDCEWQMLPKAVVWTAPAAIAGLWLCQGLGLQSPASLHTSFSIFSILLGAAIIANSVRKQTKAHRTALSQWDLLALLGIGLGGGIITAWLSVGVGELMVIYLLIRRFNAPMSVAAGVIVSALTVWSAAPLHLAPGSNALFELVLFAGPGAIIGGILARKLALVLPVKGLKLFFAFWIVLTGCVMLVQ